MVGKKFLCYHCMLMFIYKLLLSQVCQLDIKTVSYEIILSQNKAGRNWSNISVRNNSPEWQKRCCAVTAGTVDATVQKKTYRSMCTLLCSCFSRFSAMLQQSDVKEGFLQLFFLWPLTDFNSVGQEWKYVLEFLIRNILICPQLRHNIVHKNAVSESKV